MHWPISSASCGIKGGLTHELSSLQTILLQLSAANPWTYVVFGLIGFAFGFTLEMSGFGNSRKLAAQFYFTDLTVLKVMFTAIVTAMVLLFGAVGLGMLELQPGLGQPDLSCLRHSRRLDHGRWLHRRRLLPDHLPGRLPPPARSTACSSCSAASSAHSSLARPNSISTNWYNNAGYYGRLTLDQVFHLPIGVVVLLVVLMALFMFWGAEQLERIFGKKDLSKEPKLRIAGAGALFVLALGVVFIGTPSLEEKYSKLTFTRTETIPQLKCRSNRQHV